MQTGVTRPGVGRESPDSEESGWNSGQKNTPEASKHRRPLCLTLKSQLLLAYTHSYRLFSFVICMGNFRCQALNTPTKGPFIPPNTLKVQRPFVQKPVVLRSNSVVEYFLNRITTPGANNSDDEVSTSQHLAP
ncbi:hypothetical protein EYF80_008955 [Liparis tanakae]|uniref:Uncharacterized protein n=1 Tax=Liparis tanakae TaxID=230148 RepID=A0A4Z2ISA1_9TELE|nr:hypothetical protein EYF80_008955 [Liparis tanakae]